MVIVLSLAVGRAVRPRNNRAEGPRVRLRVGVKFRDNSQLGGSDPNNLRSTSMTTYNRVDIFFYLWTCVTDLGIEKFIS